MTRRRLRTRLALLHGGLAFGCGALLLAFVDVPLIVTGNTTHKPGTPPSTPAATTNAAEVLRYSAVALVVIAAVSVALGWLIAGRALRPIRVITASARAMSADTLDGSLRVTAAYREFTELAGTLDDLLRRLHGSFTAQRQFVANASHELRTPLTVQRTLLQLTLADPDATAGTLRAACEDLLALGEQQDHLIDALLTLAGGYRPLDHPDRLDLADVARRAVRTHDAQAGRRGVRIRTSLASTPVTGDARLAASLVTNLVDNAVRHNVPGGSVEVTTTPPGRLTVTNTGTVVPPADLDRLFQPFQRLGTDRTDQTGGHGLGLSIVAAIAHAHRAPVTAYARPGGGLHVTVDFATVDG